MAGDLGADDVRVNAAAVLDFWFALPKERQFAKDEALDREIAARFEGLRVAVLASGADGWRDDPDALLAAIVLTDQFGRNVHRGTARAFEGDALALSLSLAAIDRGWDAGMPPERLAFLYMPLMHAEDPAIQALSVEKFAAPGLEHNLAFAREHAAVIADYGRFPSRNAALGRVSTPAEEAYLSRPGAGW